MKEQLSRLRELQSIDEKMLSLQKQQAAQPVLLERARKNLQELESALATLKAEKRELQKSAHSREVELKTYEERILRHKMQLNVTKSNKEYATMSHEIKVEQADQSKVEDAILEILERLDQTDAEFKKLTGQMEQGKKGTEAVASAVEVRLKEIDKELKQLEKRRREMAQTIDQQALADYERVFARMGASAIAPIDNLTCKGCNMAVTAQTVNDVIVGRRLVRCPNCKCILYLAEEGIALK
jgi:predicted  nucleic acid-binding Zn-ribbon protein